MPDLLKAFLAQVGADVLGRRLRVEHVRELRFERLQAVHLLVKLAVGEGRHIENVILVIGVLQFLAQGFQFLALGFFYLAE